MALIRDEEEERLARVEEIRQQFRARIEELERVRDESARRRGALEAQRAARQPLPAKKP